MASDGFVPSLDELGGRFPPVEQALNDPNGLLAWGGDLSPHTLLAAYARGIFPWYSEGEPLLWWCPSPRAVIFPDHLHIPRRLARSLRQLDWQAHLNRDFAAVVRHCAAPRPGQPGTWITTEMQAAYQRLHTLGYARCLEVDIDGQLAGGIYGITLGRVFFGESMFSIRSNGSKLALKALCDALQFSGYHVLDCQLPSTHLMRMGAVTIPLADFQTLLPDPNTLAPAPLLLPV